MAKRFSSKRTQKTKIRLSPKKAFEIIKQEFTDEYKNKFIFIMDVKPHNPKTPTIEGTVEYKDNK